MSYGNNTNNNKKDNEKSVNTNGIQIFSEGGFDPSTLVPGFWNEKYCTMKIHPALPKEKRTDKSRYDYDSNVMAVIELEHVTSMIYVLEQHIIPRVEDGHKEDVSFTFPLKGGKEAVELGNGIKITGDINPYFAIYKDIGDNGIPGTSIATEFLTTDIWTNYDNTTGNKDIVKRYESLHAFLSFLKDATQALNKASAHATRNNLKYVISRLMENQNAIMGKLGIEVTKYGGGRSNNLGGRTFGSSNSNNTPSDTSNNIDSVSMEELDKELGGL